MSQLIWITPQGSIANLGIGVASEVDILAANTVNNGSVLRYTLISGSLPPGLSLSNNGKITGIPTYTTPGNNFFTSKSYNFVIRASSSDGTTPIDGSFLIIVTNTVNSDFTWITPAGNLGTIPSGVFYQLPLEVSETLANTTVTFSFLSGELPPGMQVVKRGFLQGVPTLLNAVAVDSAETFRFCVRATNSAGRVRDQAFDLTVTNVYAPIIRPAATGPYYLGSVFDGTLFTQQLNVTELNPNVAITWSNIGNLPPGITLDNTGLLSGYVQPLELVGEFGPTGFDGSTTLGNVFTENHEYDFGPYDFNQLNATLSYNFTIQAFDGVNYDLQEYILNVVSRSGYTADSGNITADNNSLTVDTINTYIPVLLNGDQTTLPLGRSGAYYAFKFEGKDFQGDIVTYSMANSIGAFDAYILGQDAGFDYGSSDPEGPNYTGGGVGFDSNDGTTTNTGNLPGLILDAQTGWLYGKINPQNAALTTYTFGIVVSKVRDGITYQSKTIFFKLPVQGDINNVIEWITPSNLGTINNGAISEITLEAKSIKGLPLVYSIIDKSGVPVRLPQGLSILPSGRISGRVSFETFTLDDFATTFDGDVTTIDRTFKFTVQATTDDFTLNDDGTYKTEPTATATREFLLTVNIVDQEPYDNLYLRAMPNLAQRQIFNNIVNNPSIFDPDLIYRSDDPWFGLSENMTMLFLSGIRPAELASYASAIARNHYSKTYNFGEVKTATVLDDKYQVKYEVVYVEIIDPELNPDGNGPGSVLDLTNTISNPYIDANGGQHKIVYPNTSQNMIASIVNNIGYYDQSTLPDWMTSNQPGDSNNLFSAPLGYTRAVVLAYTMPGASNLMAYRLKTSGLNFNQIEFTVDRYLLDNYFTKNFDTETNQFFKGRETTFDASPNFNVGNILTTVEYAVTTPFDQINGRSVDYVRAHGGIDGVMTFEDGDLLVFAQQEGILGAGPYDGWVGYTDGFIGDDIFTAAIEGYDSEGYDTYTVIPGYLEKAALTSPINYRGGVWKITIVNNLINLKFVQEISLNDRVRVSFGKTYGGAILYYSFTGIPGQSVPEYQVFKLQNITLSQKRTTFNGDSTKFFNFRDQYYTPGSQDKYVKFTQSGVFN